jgi:hypothetical protein
MIIKIYPDSEKAKSILKMAEDREILIKQLDIKNFSMIVSENYYEIIKELFTSIFLIKGIKSVGDYAHKELIGLALKENFLDEFEHSLIDDLRNRRNKSQYEGKQIDSDYLDNNKDNFDKIIIKLKNVIKDMIGDVR